MENINKNSFLFEDITPLKKKAYLRARHQPTVFGVVSRARNESMALRKKGRAPKCAHGKMRVPGDRVIERYFK